jgi:hypothetical protein
MARAILRRVIVRLIWSRHRDNDTKSGNLPVYREDLFTGSSAIAGKKMASSLVRKDSQPD